MNGHPPKFKVAAVVSFAGSSEADAVWFMYPTARCNFITQHPELYERQSGFVIPTFEEELLGRFILVDGTENSVKHGKPAPSPYLADLLRVHQAGFLREYVWTYCNQPSWPDSEQPGKLLPFIAWARANLRTHTLETHGGVTITREGQDGYAPKNVDAREAGGRELISAVEQITAAVQQGNHDQARQLLAPFSQSARNLHKEPDAAYHCFMSQRQLNYFLNLHHPKPPKTRVMDWCVAWGSFLNGYLLSRFTRYTEALSEIEAVLKIAPFFARGWNEKGYILTCLHRSKESLAANSHAWNLVVRHPENFDVAGPVLRGQAVALVEMGELDRAEKLLSDSLIVEPGNRVAQQELVYIAQRRKGVPEFSRTVYINGTGHKFEEQLLQHNLVVHRGRYFGPWPGIGVAAQRRAADDAKVTEDGLKLLAQLGGVTRLSLADARWTLSATKHLENLGQLRQLDLTGTEISDTEVPFFSQLPELRSLNLSRTKITDQALPLLAGLPKLEQLFLGGTQVSAMGLSALLNCHRLRYLDLEGCAITDVLLVVVSKLTHLEGLNIASPGCCPKARGVEALLHLENLQLLGFPHPSSVSEDLLNRVKRMPKLKNWIPGGCASLYKGSDPYQHTSEPLL